MKFTSQHTTLPDALYRAVEPANFPETRLIFRNTAWSSRLLLDAELADADGWINRFGRFQPFEDSFSQPLALCYHGHQFGVYNPDLGDGRGFLYAQVIDPVTGNCLDFGTKGSGQTPFS
ncbi:MAG: protein adenylyltransferase SelO family protein, partial [Candidatus Puniceispirillales bacterium]